MNLLDLVPSFKRQLNQYVDENHTDSQLAGYLADAIDALNWRWTRTYVITHTPPSTFEVSPTVTDKDKRPIILMASIIYKGANIELAGFRDGDFAWDPQQGRSNPITNDVAELDKILGKSVSLAKGKTQPLRGFSNGYNPESYSWLVSILE